MAEEKWTAFRRPVVGLPKAMLYYREHVKWETFLRMMDVEFIVSQDTDLKILNQGMADAVDEMCLSAKIYMGHVNWLIGKCDYILIPWIANYGYRHDLCHTFTAMYDICRNVYRESGQRFLTYCVDERNGQKEEDAYLKMAASLGVSRSVARKAFKAALKADAADWKGQIREQEILARRAGMKVMVAAHPYVIQDPYFGQPVMRMLENMDVTVLTADVTDRSAAVKRAQKFSSTMKWEYSMEVIGGLLDKRKVDGIVFITAFPCGPDSMVNEIYLRRKKDVPILNLVLDAQSGTAGLETRLESFIDILRLRKSGTAALQQSQNGAAEAERQEETA